MLIGYARVSTEDQNLDLQRDALDKAGCGKIFTDRASGAKVERPGLQEALGFIREGDNLVVWKLDRLGRSLSHLIECVQDLEARGVYSVFFMNQFMSRKEFNMSRTWFSSVEVAKLFNISAQTVRRWAEEGSILEKSYRIHANGRWRHDQDEVNRILAKLNRYKPRIIF